MNMLLQGIRVIDWTVFQQGPVATLMLGDLGADVIKIEELGKGDPGRGMAAVMDVPVALAGKRNAYFESNNRNKKSIALDLKKPKAKEIVYKLVGKSDVFVQNFRKGVAERLNLDYETLCKYNPKLIYAEATGYGLNGPDSALPCYDPAAQARSGFLHSLALGDECPPLVPGGLADQMGATILAYGIVSALLGRERFGIGQKVECSLLSSIGWLQGLNVQIHLFTGAHRPGRQQKEAANPLFNIYRCTDGKWLLLCLMQSDRHWPDFCQAIQHSELEKDVRFATSKERRKNRSVLIAMLDEVFRTKSCAEWLSILKEYKDFVYEPVNAISDFVNDPQVIANKFITDFEHPTLGAVKMVNVPVNLSRTPGNIRAPAPECGQHTEEVLTEICGYTWDDVAQLKDEGVI